MSGLHDGSKGYGNGGKDMGDQLNMFGYEAEWVITIDNEEKMITCSGCECRMIKKNYDLAVGNRGYRFCPYCGKRMAPYKWRWNPWKKEYETV